MRCWRCGGRATVEVPEGPLCDSHATALADDLARRVVLDRDENRCQRCGDKNRGCQWAHILARRVAPFLRHEPDNALALCAACHGEFTLHPSRFEAWLDVERPGLRDRLRRDEARWERAPVVPSLADRIAGLRSMLWEVAR